MFASNPFGPHPRRFVDKRGNKTTVTRKSAPARIAALPQASLLQISGDVIASNDVGSSRKRFSLSPSATPRNVSASKREPPIKRRTLELESSITSEDDSDSDSSYNSFILSLKKKDVLRLDTQLGVIDPLDRMSSSRSMTPSPTLKASYHSQAVTYRVLKSYYEGNLFQSSRLNAQLMVGPSKRPGQPEFFRPLFKWVHIENPDMHFGAYLEYVTRSPYLNDSERESVSTLLRTAREKSDRSLRMPPGKSGSYIEPEYFEETIENTVYQGPRSKHTKKEIVRWLAVPYFYLISASLPGSKGGKFDPSPQFTKSGTVGKGGFFQVAQLWCLILGDNFMISCARIPISEVPKTLVYFNNVPPADPAKPLTGDRAPVLQVSDGGLRLWLLPVDECETWSAFVSHFVSLGFSLVDGWQVKYREVILGPTDWTTIIAMARKCPIRLELCRIDVDAGEDDEYASSDDASEHQASRSMTSISVHEQRDEQAQTQTEPLSPPSPPILPSERDQVLTLDGSGIRPELHVDEFHVFTLLATVPIPLTLSMGQPGQQRPLDTPPPQYRIDEQQLDRDLIELDQYLSGTNARRMESLTYVECPTSSTYEVERTCSKLDTVTREENILKRALVRAARDIFELFFPLRYEHKVTLKFWGSIRRIVQTKNIKSAHGHFKEIVKDVSQLARLAKEVRQEIFSEKKVSDYITTLPHEFIQAWMLIQMYFIGLPTEHSHGSANHIRRCKERLLQGRLKMIERLQTVSIRDREAVLPLGVTVLLLGQLLHDSQGPLTLERHRLTSAYWTFFKSFKAEVYDDPLKRNYEGTFTSLKSEFELIVGTLEDQQRVLVALEDSINECESHSFAYSSTISKKIAMEPSREASVAEYLLHQTEEMLQNFWEMSRRRNDLENYHFLCLSIDNDMQQKASFAFTTVTVFFLPLTTLTGILGMNTNDIRNISDGQWLFWAVAIPLGVSCLSLWFYYLGTFETFWRWGRKKGWLGKPRPKPPRYASKG